MQIPKLKSSHSIYQIKFIFFNGNNKIIFIIYMNILRRFFVKADKKYLSRIINDITNNVHLYIHVRLREEFIQQS